jgi:hypothetical protein
LLLYPCTRATLPSQGQLLNTGSVALFSGVIATPLFLHVRSRAENTRKPAAVDVTQSSEVLFALCAEVLFLHAPLPGSTGYLGIAITVVGLIAFVRHQHELADNRQRALSPGKIVRGIARPPLDITAHAWLLFLADRTAC